MIFTERTITVVNDSATINKPLILYRGDKNIELKITIAESQFKFRNTDASNVIETTDASYAQLVINTPYNSPIFSDVAATKNGAVIFVISAAMIDEIREVGAYEIQIRLLDDNKQSRASIPPVSNAIEIREPIAIEDGSAVDSNAVNAAKVNRALTTTSAPLEAFDSQGNYIKNNWGDGDPITDAALNKMETGIDGVNKKIGNVNSRVKEKAWFISPEEFNAIGDGITDDTQAIQSAIEKCIAENKQLKISKKYRINSNDVLQLVNMFGGGEIILQGSVIFKDISNNKITIDNITFTDKVFKDEDSEVNSNVFYGRIHKENGGICMRDVIFKTGDETKRGMRNVLIRYCEGVYIENIKHTGTESCIFIADSNYVTIKDVFAKNVENCIRLTRVNNANVDNISLVNTKEQQQWWISKNNDKAVSGMDCVLTEGNAYNLKLKNISSVYAIERNIYCQSSNVEASNLYCENTDGNKFVGNSTTHANNINVNNVTVIVNDTDFTKFVAAITLYWVENVKINTIVFDRVSSTTTTYRLLHLDNGVHNVNIKNVYAKNMLTNGIVSMVATHAGDKTISDITLTDLKLIDPGDGTTTLLYTNGVGSGGFSISNVTYENIDMIFVTTPSRYLYYRSSKITNLVLNNIKVKSSHGAYPTMFINGQADINKYSNISGTLSNCKFEQFTTSYLGNFASIENATVPISNDTQYVYKKNVSTSAVGYKAKENIIANSDIDSLFCDSITDYELVYTHETDKSGINYQFPVALNGHSYEVKITNNTGMLHFITNEFDLKLISDTTNNLSLTQAKIDITNPIVVNLGERTSGTKFLYLYGLETYNESLIVKIRKIF